MVTYAKYGLGALALAFVLFLLGEEAKYSATDVLSGNYDGVFGTLSHGQYFFMYQLFAVSAGVLTVLGIMVIISGYLDTKK